MRKMQVAASSEAYSMADQVARHAKAKEEGNKRVLDIDSVYDPSFLKGLRVLVTGASRGLGYELAKECASRGATVIAANRADNPELASLEGVQQLFVDVTDEEACRKLASQIDKPIDIVINNAGYFYRPLETIENLNFAEELKMIDICAVGPLRVTAALFNAGLLKAGARVAMITSQGGSIAWRTVQNPSGHDFGHHMSKAAANMMGVLLNQELRGRGVMVTNLHPGFNRTDMTEKYKEAWDVEGAVEPSVGAKRVMHEISRMTPETAGGFVNCEDGLSIPW